jgi:hypothetical protein
MLAGNEKGIKSLVPYGRAVMPQSPGLPRPGGYPGKGETPRSNPERVLQVFRLKVEEQRESGTTPFGVD